MGSGRKSNGTRPVRGVDSSKGVGKKQMSKTRRQDEGRFTDFNEEDLEFDPELEIDEDEDRFVAGYEDDGDY